MGLLKKITKWIRRAKKAREQRRRLDVEWTLPSGLTVQVEDQGEWLIYNDIFVDGEYDLPLQKALKSIISKDIVTIVDVGANVGFFALKAADWFFRNCNTDHDFRIVCIEGSPHVFEKLQGRVLRETLLAGRITLIHGLVGQRAGKGKIVEKPFHAMNRVDALAKSKEKWVLVPYVDLPLALAHIPAIDLLKCDIEGSELELLESSPELFSKVRFAVFELHDYNCDTQKCRRILNELGFVHCQTIRAVPNSFSLEFYSRSVEPQ